MIFVDEFLALVKPAANEVDASGRGDVTSSSEGMLETGVEVEGIDDTGVKVVQTKTEDLARYRTDGYEDEDIVLVGR